MTFRLWTLRVLRNAGITALILILFSVAAIQIRQLLFRHQAERLHAEILTLQLHPGTFADVQRLQREWGAYGDYRGPCTERHCIYEIEFEDGWRNRQPGQSFYSMFIRRPWFFGVYFLFGGHAARAGADVRVRDNKMWGADFFLGLAEYPGTGRNNWEFYQDSVDVSSGTRLSRRGDLPVREIRQGFRTMEALNCLGCEFVMVNMTPQTDASDIERFNHIQFNCLTGWRSCKHPADLAPTLWAQALRDEQDQKLPDENPCLLTTQTLARETNDIALVKVLSVKSVRSTYETEPGWLLTVRVLEPMKNARLHRTTDVLTFSAGPDAVATDDGKDQFPVVVGNEYFFLYQQLTPDEIGYPTLDLSSCHALPDTPENAAEIQRGIALDPSAGEPYDYGDEPYTEP